MLPAVYWALSGLIGVVVYLFSNPAHFRSTTFWTETIGQGYSDILYLLSGGSLYHYDGPGLNSSLQPSAGPCCSQTTWVPTGIAADPAEKYIELPITGIFELLLVHLGL